jgi:hypothetical protein
MTDDIIGTINFFWIFKRDMEPSDCKMKRTFQLNRNIPNNMPERLRESEYYP